MTDLDLTPQRLREMWDRHDPVPDDLIEKVLVAIATEDLDAEYELLFLVERERELVGARGSGESYTITFSRGGFSLLLRVSADGERRRVDGWVTPARPMTVRATQHGDEWDTKSDQTGRFELTGLPHGLTRFWLSDDDEVASVNGSHPPAESADDTDTQSFATPTFEL